MVVCGAGAAAGNAGDWGPQHRLALPAKREQEMANEGNLVAWCKRERESLQMQREMLQSGKFRILKDEGSGQVDTTSDSIERITANINELDAILADYEASVPRA